MHLSQLDLTIWAASFFGNLLLSCILFLRGRARSFPLFTLYIVYQAIDNVIGSFVARNTFTTYQLYFWSANLGEQILKLLVFYEVAIHVFRPTGVWARDVHKTFIGLVALSLIVAGALTWLPHPKIMHPIEGVILRGTLFSSLLLSELCVGMVVLSGTVGLPWKTHVARIAQGLGTCSLFRAGAGIIQNSYGIRYHGHWIGRTNHASNIVYVLCTFYWIVTLYADAPVPRELPEAMRMQIYTLHRHVEDDLARIRAWRKI